MKKARFTKPLTIALPKEIYNQAKQETDENQISLSEWFRDAATLKIQTDQTKKEEKKDE